MYMLFDLSKLFFAKRPIALVSALGAFSTLAIPTVFSLFMLLQSMQVNAQAQNFRDLETLDELDRYRELIDAMEAEYGRYAMDLIEPLESFADQLTALNQFDEADDMLDRAVQITRFNDGLHTEAQLSLIKKRIDNFSNRQAWDDARELMEYLLSYYLRVPVLLNENLLDDFLVLAEQHLRGVTEAPDLEQGFHFYRAHQLNWAMISTAKKLYGAQSSELVPYLYRQIQHLYMNRKVHDNIGAQRTGLRRSLRDESRRDWAVGQMKKVDIERLYYLDGLRLFDEIGNIYAQANPPDLVGQAMMRLYLADWANLFDFADTAAETYRLAYLSLISAGVTSEQLNVLFAKPRILPVQQFYPDAETAATELVASDTNDMEISFSEWTTAIPTARSPLPSFAHDEDEMTTARFEFELVAENESTLLYKHQYRQSIGTAYNEGLVEGFSGIASGAEEALYRLEQLRFRPKLVDGELAESQIFLSYDIAIEDAD